MTDRELNALVAEKVMGWTYWRSKHGHWTITDPSGNKMEPLFGQVFEFDARTGKRLPVPAWHEGVDLPRYSSTGDGMLAVIEKMREKGWDFDIGWNDEFVDALFSKNGGTPDSQGGRSDALPLPRAVALAALKAVGVEVES